MSDEKMPPESERTHFRKEANKIFLFPTRLCFEKAPVDTGTAVSSAIFSLTCHVWSRYYQPCQSLGKNKNQSLTSALKCVLSFSEGISSLEVK